MSLIGDWQIDYVETHTNTTISFYPNGTFYQKAGHYIGRWSKQKDGLNLTLRFDTLTLPNEVGPITLDAKINDDFKTFSGIKPNNAYAGGALHYNARLISSTNQNQPCLNSQAESEPQTKAQAQAQTRAEPVGATLIEDDNDSPCQVRRTRR